MRQLLTLLVAKVPFPSQDRSTELFYEAPEHKSSNLVPMLVLLVVVPTPDTLAVLLTIGGTYAALVINQISTI